MTVVGVCGDHIHDWFERRNYPTLYRPFRQAPTTSDGARRPHVARSGERSPPKRARPCAPSIPSSPSSICSRCGKSLHERTIGLQYVGAIMFVFGGLALLLAVVGVYGVMAYMVAQRTHEIGVRMALGATRRDVLQLTVGQTGRLTAVGVALGIVLSFLLRPTDRGRRSSASRRTTLRITGGLAAILVASALVAGYLPARRAASIDPTVALRGE